MPNHVTSRITFEGPQEDIDHLKDLVKTEESEFDFNNIISMPTELRGTTAPQRQSTTETEAEFKARVDDLLAKYGAESWYDWAIANWGTKWNAYDIEWSGNQVQFYTAWEFPYPVISRLAELFPTLTISFLYADEDTGYNTGRGYFEKGEYIDGETPEGGGRGGYENYFELHPGSRESYRFNEKTGRYDYIGEDEE